MPKTRVDFWKSKFRQNVRRDRKNENMLVERGWSVLTIWECETTKPLELSEKLAETFPARANPAKLLQTPHAPFR